MLKSEKRMDDNGRNGNRNIINSVCWYLRNVLVCRQIAMQVESLQMRSGTLPSGDMVQAKPGYT